MARPKGTTGIPKSTGKSGGRGCHRPPPGMKGAELRRWILDQSGAVESLVRLARGNPIRLKGPTGKFLWHYPDVSQVMWAIERCLKKALPDLAGLQLTGGEKDDEPIKLEGGRSTGLPDPDAELARRLCLVLGVPFSAPQDSPDKPNNGSTILPPRNGNGAQRALSAPAQVNGKDEAPAVGEVVTWQNNVTVQRMSDDKRGGGDFLIRQGDKNVKTLRGLDFAGVRQVVEAMQSEGRFDATS